MIEIILLVIFGCGVGAGFLAGAIFKRWREEAADPLDWTAAAYEPRHDQPRVVTRIHSNELDWEIK